VKRRELLTCAPSRKSSRAAGTATARGRPDHRQTARSAFRLRLVALQVVVEASHSTPGRLDPGELCHHRLYGATWTPTWSMVLRRLAERLGCSHHVTLAEGFKRQPRRASTALPPPGWPCSPGRPAGLVQRLKEGFGTHR
jgi:hypothetical protein